jgi:hypothetical protein
VLSGGDLFRAYAKKSKQFAKEMNTLRFGLKPSAVYFYELYQETGRRLPIGKLANILMAIIAPGARRLMCDISPCGGGRGFLPWLSMAICSGGS